MDAMHVDLHAETSGPGAASLYRSIFERSSDAIAIIAPDGRYVEQNAAHARLTGCSTADLRGQTPAMQLGEATFAAVLRRLAADGYFFGEVMSRHRDGHVRAVELSAFPVHDARGGIVAYVGVKRDVSARRAAEAELHRRFGQLHATYRMTAALTAATDLDEIYREALDCLCSALQAGRASILLFDPDGVLRFKAWRDLSEAYRTAVEGHNPWPAGVERRAFVIRDVAGDPSLGSLRTTVLAEGIAAAAFIPLLHHGVLLGKLMVYFGTPHDLDEEELRLADAIASHIAVAIARHRHEEALRTSEREYETLAENSPDIIARFDRQLRHLYVNRAITAATGLAPTDFIGRTNREMGMSAELVAQWEADLRRVFDTGEAAVSEFCFATPSGPRWYSSNISPEMLEGGVVRTVLSATRDITPLKQAEARQRLLADVGAAMVSHLDYRDALAAAVQLIIREFADGCAIDLADDGGVLQRVAMADRDPAIVRTLQELEAVNVPLLARGRCIGVITLVVHPPRPVFTRADIAFAEELAGRIALAVDNLRLYHESLAANRTRSDFMATMSHELRTPLNAIMGYTDLLELGVPGPITASQARQLERIRTSNRHLLTVIEDILTFSRVEAGRETLHREAIEAVELVRDAASMVEVAARDKGLCFDVRTPEPPVRMIADPVRLRQVLLNLLSNAVKFTEAGSVELALRPNGGNVQFCVTDTGSGIEPEHSERIYEPFWQAQSGNTRRVGGTGLGLTVSRQLVELMGGTLTMTSAPGRGSTFTVTLPRAQSPER